MGGFNQCASPNKTAMFCQGKNSKWHTTGLGLIYQVSGLKGQLQTQVATSLMVQYKSLKLQSQNIPLIHYILKFKTQSDVSRTHPHLSVCYFDPQNPFFLSWSFWLPTKKLELERELWVALIFLPSFWTSWGIRQMVDQNAVLIYNNTDFEECDMHLGGNELCQTERWPLR